MTPAAASGLPTRPVRVIASATLQLFGHSADEQVASLQAWAAAIQFIVAPCGAS